jgi:hypothetical protein
MPDLFVRGVRVSSVVPYFAFFDLVDGIFNYLHVLAALQYLVGLGCLLADNEGVCALVEVEICGFLAVDLLN